MQKRTSILTFVLIMALFIGLFSGTANAADPIDVTTDDTAIVLGKTVTQDQLASAAIAYVRKYVNTAYLYKAEDFITCTLLDASIPTQPSSLTVNGVISTTTDLRADLQQFMDVANYFKVTRSANQIERYNFKFTPYIQEVVIDETSAYVKLYINLSFQYEENGEPAACGDHYEVQFANVGNSWCIVNVIAEEIEAYGLAREQFDCEEALLEFVPVAPSASTESIHIDADAVAVPMDETVITAAGTAVHRRYYNRTNAIAYAYNYTTSAWNSSLGNNNEFMNSNFTDYTGLGGNCQNFAS